MLISSNEPIVNVKTYLEYKRAGGHIDDTRAPETVLVCYQSSTMQYLLKQHSELQPYQSVTHCYLYHDASVGILGDWGVGAPGLAIKMEELVELGTKRFIAVGTSGELMNTHQIGDFILCPRALAEDGVAHLYLPHGQHVVDADPVMLRDWATFAQEKSLPLFRSGMAWSFPAIFRETLADVYRVQSLGCSVVEMEAATLYAIGQEKGVQALSLFVISDSITEEAWVPHIKEPAVRTNLHKLADWALEFCHKL
jgi:purine-nucleoside phosphorylase